MNIRTDGALCATFSLRLAAARKKRGMSQKEVGDRAGLHPSHISCMEGGKRHPMLETVYRVATALDCSIDYLLGLTSHMDGEVVSRESYDELVVENETLRQIIKDAMREPTTLGHV